jgi:F-type H+-transporting ATPase subunit a
MAHDPLDHVLDSHEWALFETLGLKWTLPKIHIPILDYDLQITRFMVLQLIACAIVAAIYIPLARRIRTGDLPKGGWWNGFESLLTFIRNDVAEPNLHEDTDTYLPFLWTMFLFILVNNLLGLVPTLGSPTAQMAMTIGLAVFSLILFHAGAIAKLGFVHYLQSMWPGIEHQIPFTFGIGWAFGFIISLMIFAIEFAGTFIKSTILAVRLCVNLFAGHVILASLLLIIVTVGEASQGVTLTWSIATVISVLGVTALSVMELFVAFLQAYVFVFLTSLFLGMALHPSH